jgi:hypothetical protein
MCIHMSVQLLSVDRLLEVSENTGSDRTLTLQAGDCWTDINVPPCDTPTATNSSVVDVVLGNYAVSAEPRMTCVVSWCVHSTSTRHKKKVRKRKKCHPCLQLIYFSL